jgi:MFS family permease
LFTQASQAALALGLAILTLTGLVQLWHVYVFALLFGCVTAFDAPARQTFVAELVGEKGLANAVGLNSTSFNSARMIGPAVAGLLIAAMGTGEAFLINGLSYVAVLGSLLFLRVDELFPTRRAAKSRTGLIDGFRYVWKRPDLKIILLMLALIGTFGMNFPIFISTMTVTVFHAGAGRYGALASVMAIGTVVGALLAARRERPHMGLLLGGAAVFGASLTCAAWAPNEWIFAAFLAVIGISALTFANTTNSLIQLSTDPVMRGRMMAMRIALARGSALIGAPIVGAVADHFGPRWSLMVGATAGFLAALVALYYLIRYRRIEILRERGRWQLRFRDTPPSDLPGLRPW